MIQYPEGLPLPQRDGYGFTPGSALLRTQMQSGRARQRRQYASVPTVAAVRWRLNDVQAQLFESWFEEVLNSGAEWFECPLKTPQGRMLYRARFVDVYTGPTLIGHSWDFEAQLELWEKPVLRGGWAVYAPSFMLYMGQIDKALNQEWPEA